MRTAVVALLALVAVAAAQTPVDPDIVPIQGFTQLKSSNESGFYQIVSAGAESYGYPVYLVSLKGSRYQMGYDYGYMLANEIQEVYTLFMHALLPSPSDEPIEKAIEDALDWQWNDYLSVELPEQYKQELQGITDGGRDAGNDQIGNIITRVITLANAPGDVSDFLLILLREWGIDVEKILHHTPIKHKIRGMCSMFGTWGSRTQNNYLFSGRNLDWNENTGIHTYKAVTVWSPSDGSIPHVATGYVGV